MCIGCAETEEGFVKVSSERPILIDQTVRHDVDLDEVILPSAMIKQFTQLKHFVKVYVPHVVLPFSALMLLVGVRGKACRKKITLYKYYLS